MTEEDMGNLKFLNFANTCNYGISELFGAEDRNVLRRAVGVLPTLNALRAKWLHIAPLKMHMVR